MQLKIHGAIKIGSKQYQAGDEIPWQRVYPFFLLHMLMFGTSGFVMAYADNRPELSFLYMHGGIAVAVYTGFYLAIFGLDEVKWMILSALFGILGIYNQVGWLLKLFGRDISSYPLQVHFIPFAYFTLYSFLVRRALLDITGSTDNAAKREKVEGYFIRGTLGINATCFVLQQLAA